MIQQMSRGRNDPAHPPRRARSQRLVRARTACAVLALSVAAALATALPAHSVYSGTGGTVITATIPSSTQLDTSGCRAATPGTTSFGTVLPGSFVRTTNDCVVTYGSSNDAPRLLTFQSDGTGNALAKATDGAYDLAFDGNTGTGDGSVQVAGATDVSNPDYLSVQLATDPTSGLIYLARPLVGGMTRINRFLPTGVLDLAWDGPSGSGNGTVDLDLHTFTGDYPQAILVQPDGRVVLASHGGNGFNVTRLTTTGTLDTTFGTGGTTNVYLDPVDGEANDVDVDQLGRIYVGGWRDTPTTDFVVFRLTTDGVQDSSWGSGGVASTAMGGLYSPKMAVQPDGKVVLAGFRWSGNPDFAFARFLPTGALDPAFDGPTGTGNGQFEVITNPGWDSFVYDVDVAADGDVVAVGRSSDGNAVIMRLDGTTGALDTAFDGVANGNGILSSNFATSTTADAVLVDADGYVTVAGSMTGGGDTDSWIARLTPTGTLDTSFDGPSGASNGLVLTDTAPGQYDGILDLMRATDGDLVAAGIDGPTRTGRLLRADSVTIPDYATGSADWAVGASGAFGMCLSTATGTGVSVTSAWTTDARCSDLNDTTNGTWWDDVPDNAADPDAQVASLSSQAVNGVARFRYGVRFPANQAPGRFQAPITFQVAAP